MITKLREEFQIKYADDFSTVKKLESLSSKIGISKNTLRRFLGKMSSESNPSLHTINAISKSLNYINFEDFKFKKENFPALILDDGTKLFYDFLKQNKLKEQKQSVFQNINILNAEKIINNPELLRQFYLEYRDSPDVIEFVLGWHPSYHRFACQDYQMILHDFAKHSKISHFEVFTKSIVIIGNYLSENHSNSETDFQNLEKSYRKMIKKFGNFYPFPIARFTVAKTLFLSSQSPEKLDDFIKEQIQLPHKLKLSDLQTIVHHVHFADALNLIGRYEEANQLLKFYNEENFDRIWNLYYPEKYKYLFRVTKMMSLLGLKKIDEAKTYFDDFKIDFKDKNLTFDIASYIQLQYCTLGCFLDKNNSDYYFENMRKMIEETQFSYWNQIFKRLKC